MTRYVCWSIIALIVACFRRAVHRVANRCAVGRAGPLAPSGQRSGGGARED